MAYTLKDGSTVEDPRLDRLIEFDVRSRQYNVNEILESKKPRSYTWRCDTHLDQGPDGACVGFAWAHELAARPKVIKGLNYEFAKKTIYWEAQKIDYWPGGSYPGADPFYEGTSVLAGAKIVKDLGFIDSYLWAFNMEDALKAIGHVGPVVLGVNWYSNMFSPDSNGFIRPTGTIAGGHAILGNSVNWRLKRVGIFNSWGEWGINGMAYLTFDDFEKLLYEQGEVCIPVGRNFTGK